MIIISACLAGINCRYDANTKPNEKIIELIKQGKAIPICPEQLGGLPTPRPAAEQKGNKVFTKEGKEVTLQFEKGANEALKIALTSKATKAILKARSPSCGCGQIYDGTFSGKLIEGDGVFCSLLKKHSIKVETEENYNS